MRDPRLDEPCSRGHRGERRINKRGWPYCLACCREKAIANNIGYCWTGRHQTEEHKAKREPKDGVPYGLKHGHRPHDGMTPTYVTWLAMKRRVRSKKRYYEHVTIDERWLGPDGYANFLSDMGERPEGMTIDRIDGTRGYSPDNCRWADYYTQATNRRTPEQIASAIHA